MMDGYLTSKKKENERFEFITLLSTCYYHASRKNETKSMLDLRL